jgi:hypothetical protein
MDIQPSLLSALLPVKTGQTILTQWLPGQILNARVVSQQLPGTVVLEINNQQIEAKTSSDKPLDIGSQLKLVVEKQGNPVVLRVVQHESAVSTQEARQQLLRHAIPRQAGMEKMSTLLNQISNNIRSTVTILPAPIEQQIKKLIENFPIKESIKNPSTLKTVIKNAGIFLEAKLLTEITNKQATSPQSRAPASPPNESLTKDLKTNLLQVSDVILKYKQAHQKTEAAITKQIQPLTLTMKESTPAAKPHVDNTPRLAELTSSANIDTISKHIESSIARIEVNQSKAMVTNDNQFATWSIETPVKDKNDVDLLKLDVHADKQAKSDNKKDQLWTVHIKIDFQDSGSISAKLSMLDNEVSATLWSEDVTLHKLINENLRLLDRQIERCGLTIGKIVCLDGCPVGPECPTPDKLINIKV